MRRSTTGLGATLWLLTAALASPVAGQSRVTTGVDMAFVTVGDRIALTVTVDHAPSARVVWPDSLDLAPFEVLDRRTLPDQPAGDLVRSSLVLSLAAFELGELEVPSFEVAVAGADGATEPLASDPVGVVVESVGADDSGNIRDIRGPMGIPLGALRLALWILLSLIIAGLLWVLARRLRPRKVEATSAAAALPRPPPHEVALRALAALEASPMLARGEVKEFHIAAADMLRTYAERRYGVDAREMTTHEVLAALRKRRADARFVDGLSAFLEQCDLVKFAKVRPDPDASRGVLGLGRRIVLDSVPVAEPEPVPADAGAPEGA